MWECLKTNKEWVILEKTSSASVSSCAVFSSEGVQLHQCAEDLHRWEASLETHLPERTSSFPSAHSLQWVRLCNSAPSPGSAFHFRFWSSVQQSSTKWMCFKKCQSLRSRFLTSISHYLNVRYLESNRRGFFSLSVCSVQTELSLACFRKSRSKTGVTSLNSFTIITVDMGYSVPQN